jgi:hypothetical protein
MLALRPRGRDRDLAYVRNRAAGLSIRRAAMLAGFSPHGSYRVERRLAGEVELRKRRNAGLDRINGKRPYLMPKNLAQRLLEDLSTDG